LSSGHAAERGAANAIGIQHSHPRAALAYAQHSPDIAVGVKRTERLDRDDIWDLLRRLWRRSV